MNKDQEKIVIHLQGVNKSYNDGVSEVKVLKDLDLTVHTGELVAIVGASGSGKSTLLHVIGGLDKSDSGLIEVADQNVNALSETKRDKLRNEMMGFVYQFHHLLPEFTALENVALPLLIHRDQGTTARQRAKEVLQKVNLGHRLDHLPSQLSGGERQRVAIARALVANPLCVLADEPTGNLDSGTAGMVFDLFVKLARESKSAVVIVTHDESLARLCDRALRLEDGKLIQL